MTQKIPLGTNFAKPSLTGPTILGYRQIVGEAVGRFGPVVPATHPEVSAGTNAAIPAAMQFVNSFIPDFYQADADAKVPQLVAIVVATAIPAVDAYRAAHPLPQTPRRLTMLAGWKTLIFGVAVAVSGVLQTFNWATVVPQNATYSGYVMLFIGGAIVFLRYVTTTPIATTPTQVVENVKKYGTLS